MSYTRVQPNAPSPSSDIGCHRDLYSDFTARVSGGTLETQPPTVLVVTDEAATAAALVRALEEDHIQALVAADAEQIRRITQATHPKVFLVDFALQQRVKLELGQLLGIDSQGRRQTPLISIVAQHEIPAALQPPECGAADYITKPVTAAEALIRVRIHLRLSAALEELELAHNDRLQIMAAAQRFCMRSPSELQEARFAVQLQAAHKAGGDFYDVISLGSSQFDYIVADASGHDLASSFWTLALKTLLVEYFSLIFSPMHALSLINRALVRILPEETFFSLGCVRVDRESGMAALFNAGHVPAIFIPAGSGKPSMISQPSDVIGCFSDAVFSRTDLSVAAGDRIFLFSDGLVDGPAGPNQKLDLLFNALCQGSGRTLNELVEDTFAEQLQVGVPADDAVLMGIEI